MKKEVDPFGGDPHTPGVKLDGAKPLAWTMISGFSNALKEVAAVTTVGAIKYTPEGWVHVHRGEERYMEAFARHMLDLGSGEIIDEDTKCMHLAQIAWNALAVLELQLRKKKNG